MLAKFASIVAHKSLAKLVDLGAVPVDEQTGVARSEEKGLQVIVIIAPYAGPPRLHPATLEKIAAMGALEASKEATKCPSEPASSQAAQPPRNDPRAGRAVEACILEAVPGPADKSVSMKRLAVLAGYKYTLWFRAAVDSLIVAGELVRTSQGVRRANE